MNRYAVQLGSVALVLSAAVAACVWGLLPPSPNPPRQPQEQPVMVPIVVARTDIGRFTTITADLLTLKDVAEQTVRPDAFKRMEDVKGRTLIYPATAGEAILESNLASRADQAAAGRRQPARK